MGMLRFYLCTTPKEFTETEDSDLAEHQHENASLSSTPTDVVIVDELNNPTPAYEHDDALPYSNILTEFYDYATEGQDMRVPALSSKRKEEEWKSIGRILVKGFRTVGISLVGWHKLSQ
ncbi:hypothetical protein WMY93_000692 [Mugilogobius chulae]|uniref:Uncharacterized protein n=1 Tax=Mugilogobius chulae TaxID=88201 RepID=A0AAW0Q007_9GOBI